MNVDNIENRVELRVLNVSNSQVQANAFALVLEDINSSRQLPIIIGALEAQAIAFTLKGLSAPRPLTHELFTSFAEYLEVELDYVFIYKALDGIFYSSLCFVKDGKQFGIDSRTSDAVALALRFTCPIYTTKEILDSEGFDFEEEDVVEEPKDVVSLEILYNSLDEAIKSENYELASTLRDEIKRITEEQENSNL